MAVTPIVFIPAVVAAAAETTQYTSTNAQTIIDKFTATNKSGGTVQFAARLVNAGATAGSGVGEISVRVNIQAEKTYSFPEFVGHTLAVGDYVSTLPGTANTIELRASGRLVT